tara:strand:- start:1336 stop:1692 length:357 start_codon:yes stop_codon:yes gene_type:complete
MKFRFASSDKEYELPTTTSTISQSTFMEMLYTFIFKEKDPTCSFEIINLREMKSFNCETDVPVVKKGYAKLFQKPNKMEMTKQQIKKPKKRWRSRSPVKRKKRVRRWRSRSPKRNRWL